MRFTKSIAAKRTVISINCINSIRSINKKLDELVKTNPDDGEKK